MTWNMAYSIAVRGPALVACLLCAACGFQDPITNGTLTVPEGFEVEIAAGPPLVERPMIVDMDEHGYLYVAESSGSNDPVQQQLAEKPHSILRLEDINGDGHFDRRVVFADKMMLPEGVLWHDGSLYVAAPPVIWKLTDIDGDGTADRREEWFDAKTLTNCANDLHGPYLGPDGWIYWTKGGFAEQIYERPGHPPLVTRAAHIFRRRPEGGPVEAVLTGGMDNPVEVAFTPEGERLLTATFLQHPYLGRRDGILHAVYGGVYGKVHNVTDRHPMTGGYLPVMTHLGPGAPVGLARYRSSAFGESYRNNLFVTLFNMHKVTRHELQPIGATYETKDFDFLVSDSSDFHPTDVMEDVDGSLLIVDTGAWYKLCCPTSQLSKPDLLGAIYRVKREDSPKVHDPRGDLLGWKTVTADGLTARLTDERPFVRKRVMDLFAKKGEAAASALTEVLLRSTSIRARRNAVWVLARISGTVAREGVRRALADPDASVKHAAIHAVSIWRDVDAVEALVEELKTGEHAIKRVSAEALGRIGDSRAVPHLLNAVSEGDLDEVLIHSLTYALIEIGNPKTTRLELKNQSRQARRAALLALDQMGQYALDPSAVIPFLSSPDPILSKTAEWITGRHPEWGQELSGFFSYRLRNLSVDKQTALENQLQKFMGDPAIQQLVASIVVHPGTTPARLTALRSMAAANPEGIPPGWSTALAAALASQNRSVSAEAVTTARKLPREELSKSIINALAQVARNPQAIDRARIEALEIAAKKFGPLSSDLFSFLVEHTKPTEPVAVRTAAARALATVLLSREQLEKLSGVLPEVGPMELPLLIEAFAAGGDERLGRQWLQALSKARGLANLRADILERVAAAYPEPIRKSALKLIAQNDDRDAQRRHLEKLLDSLKPGDIRAGQTVFNSSEAACSSCHAIGNEGGRVGPDLTQIGKIRDERDLLEALVFPSASFVRSYEPLVVVTTEETYSGVPLEKSETHILLAVGAEEQAHIPRARIEEVRPGTVSVMPSGLDKQITEQELADLVAFLKATRWGPD